MESTPLVSVIVPTFDRRDVVDRAVASALTQGHSEIEVNVEEDKSIDDTRQIPIACTDPRLRLTQAPKAYGSATPRNVGVAAARGKYVAFIDSDDEYRPGDLAIATESFAPGHLLCRGNATLVKCDGTDNGPAFTSMPRDLHTSTLLRSNWIITSTVVAHLETLGPALPSPVSPQLDICEYLAAWPATPLKAPWRILAAQGVKDSGATEDGVEQGHNSERYPHDAPAVTQTIRAVRAPNANRDSATPRTRRLLTQYEWRWRLHGMTRHRLGQGRP